MSTVVEFIINVNCQGLDDENPKIENRWISGSEKHTRNIISENWGPEATDIASNLQPYQRQEIITTTPDGTIHTLSIQRL